MKKILSMVLCLCMIISCVPILSFADDAPSGGIDGLESYLKFQTTLQNDGYIGIPVDIYTYYNEEFNPDKDTTVIFYVINTNTERVGMESDYNILNDLINNKGYICIVADFKNNPKAVRPDLDYSMLKLQDKAASLKNGIAHVSASENSFVLPAGYSITLGEYYWSIDKHGADGCLEQIVNVWNNDFKSVKANKVINYKSGTTKKVSETTAETIYDCVKPDGSPIDMDLRMDIIYPVKPKNKVPVYMNASSWETRAGGILHNAISYGFLFSGYALAVYDYCYVPMARDDHYGYFDGDGMGSFGYVTGDNCTYSLGVYTNMKSDTAAVRKLRYLADTEPEKYAFDVNKFGVYGASKQGNCLKLGAKHPEKLAEYRTFEGHHGETRYDNGKTEGDGMGENGSDIIRGGEPQPWLTYKDGSEIPSNVQFVYGAVGSGYEDISEGHAPTFNSGSMQDNSYQDFYPAIVGALRKYNIPSICLSFKTLGHAYVKYINDNDYGINGYNAFFDLANYYLKDEGARVEYIDYHADKNDMDAKAKITFKFSGEADESEVRKIVIKNKLNGEIAEGSYSSEFGDTEWTFEPHNLKGGCEYSVYVPETIVCKNGKKLKESKHDSFKVKPEVMQKACEISSDSGMTLLKTDSKNDAVYFVFDKTDFSDQTSVYLRFSVTNDAANTVLIYAIDQIDETDIKNSEAGELLGEAVLTGKGDYEIDVTDYVKSLNGKKPGFILKAKDNKQTKTIALYDFESSEVGDTKVSDIVLWKYAECAVTDEKNTSDGGSKSLKVSYMKNNNWKNGLYHVWTDRLNRTVNIYKLIKKSGLDAADMGRKFKISFNIFDERERSVMYLLTPYGSSDYSKIDFKSDKYTQKTKAGEWKNFSFDYRIDEEIETKINKQDLGIWLYSATAEEENRCAYIDDIKVEEQIDEVNICSAENEGAFAPSLVLHPADKTTLYASKAEYVNSTEKNTEGSDSIFVSGRAKTIDKDICKTYIKLDLSNYDGNRAYFGFETAEGNEGLLYVYAITDKNLQNWNENSINYFNAPANDRFGFGVNEKKCFTGAPIANYEVSGKKEYVTDITNAAKTAKAAGSGYITLVFACASKQNKSVNTEDFNSEFLKTGVYPGGGLSAYGRDDKNNRSGKSGYSYYMTCGQYGYERLRIDIANYKKITEADIGKSFRVTYYVKSNMAGTYENSLTQRINTSFKQKTVQTIAEAGKWQKMTYDFTLTSNEVVDVSDPDNKVAALLDFEKLSPGQTIYIDDMTLELSGGGKINITPLENFSVPKTVSAIDFDDWNVGKVDKKNFNREVNDVKAIGVSGFEADTRAEITTAFDTTGGGKSFLFVPNKNYNRLKFYNIFDHNLTADDVGRTVNISFKARSDKQGSFYYGLMSSLQRDNSGSYLVCDGFEPDTQDYAEKFYKTSYTGKIEEKDVGKWKTYSFDVTVDEGMLAKKIYQKTNTDNKYDIAIALLGMRPEKDLVGANIYIDDICVTEKDETAAEVENPYSYYQDFENVSKAASVEVGDGREICYMLDGKYYYNNKADKPNPPGSKYVGFIDKSEISDEQNYTEGGAKSLKFTSHVSWNRFKLANAVKIDSDGNVDASQAGKTYEFSFYARGNMAKSLKLGLVADNTSSLKYDNGNWCSDYQYKPQTVTLNSADTWQKITYTVVIDDVIISKGLKNFGIFPVFDQKLTDTEIDIDGTKYIYRDPSNTAVVYIDDFYAHEAVPGEKNIMKVCAKASISGSGAVNKNILTAAGEKSSDNVKYINKAYVKFDGGEYDKTLEAVLSFEAEKAKNKKLNLWMITTGEYPENLTYENAPASEEDEQMKLPEVYGGTPIQFDLNEEGVYSADVTDYVKNNSGRDYIFAFTGEETGGSECVFDYQNGRFTEGMDYILLGENSSAAIENGALKASGAVGLLNAFGQDEAAEVGGRYAVSADVCAASDGEITIAASDRNGEIKESASYSLTAGVLQNIKLDFTAQSDDICTIVITGTDITADNIIVREDNSIQLSKNVTLDMSIAKDPETEDTRKFYEISVSSSDGSVFVNGEDKGSAYTGQHETGDVITLKTAGEGEFLYWIDMADRKIISKNESFDFTVGTAKTIAAVYAQKNAAFVTFTSLGTTVLAAGEAQSFNVPKDPYVYGYEFAGWYDEKDKLSAYKSGDLVTDAKNESYKAGFVRKETKYKITVNGEEKTYSYNDKVTIIAEAKKDGKAFSYWEKDGKIVSYDLQYGFYANEDSVVNAVYGESADSKNVLVMANPVMADETRIAFFAERNISSGCEIIETGILMGKAEGLTLESASIKAVAKSKAQNGQYTVRKKGVVSGDVWYGRAYVIYRDSTGEIVTIYSNEVFKTI